MCMVIEVIEQVPLYKIGMQLVNVGIISCNVYVHKNNLTKDILGLELQIQLGAFAGSRKILPKVGLNHQKRYKLKYKRYDSWWSSRKGLFPILRVPLVLCGGYLIRLVGRWPCNFRA